MEAPQLAEGDGYFDKLKRDLKKKLDDTPKRSRGKICTLCDRKFLLVSQLASSFKEIDSQTMALKGLQQVVEKMVERLQEQQKEHDSQCEQNESHI
jgi:uncharacterized protein with von Willebrand factor type A (vWA) domain